MRRGLLVLALLVSAVFVATGARAEDKLPTDEIVRTEMKVIRDLTLNAHTLVTHRRMPPVDAKTFHQRVKAAVERLRTGTGLDGGVRDELENLTRDILVGAEAIARSPSSMEAIDGIVSIDEALARYATRFDHPGWQPLR
ncbi:hypothetical protein [Hyphomicrobium sp. LHD-15]|uniref:hypothetical protein n=1 Tax=Hyphomicrobium sp. LHD-15 TaxID=3072142 RepID=UPI00280CCBB6|nr:hypothetical protein [Hyphomicrobium sp. LHD-15]MDQ8700464.1 hypothetical protein [Hyphomicrobium sp. LHD-15]